MHEFTELQKLNCLSRGCELDEACDRQHPGISGACRLGTQDAVAKHSHLILLLLVKKPTAVLRRDPGTGPKGHIDGKLHPLTDEQWASVEPTTLTVFHKPDDKTSARVLAKITAARECYPAAGSKPTARDSFIFRGPLKLELKIEERAPTTEEFRAIATFLPEPSFHSFLPADSTHWPTGPAALAALAARDPAALAWPIVVDWKHEMSSIGGVSITDIFKAAATRRKKVHKSKEEADKKEPPPPPPKKEEWIDYD
ncbi:hypothetical protein FB451DRAFT_1188847 [Mycena latifolia]|nr:hypothetical protein FB451DRAFT_1188847 [Mycena latifolia]